MKLDVLVRTSAALILAAAVLAWSAVRQEREFRRLLSIGDAALSQDRTYQAIEAFSGALALNSDSMVAHLKRGDSYRQRGELREALRDLRQAVDLDATAPRPLELLADVNTDMGRYARAAELYRRALMLDDRAPRVLYKLALAHYRNGQPALGLDPLRRALALDDRLVQAHYLMGLCLRDEGRSQDAVRALVRATTLDRAFIPAHEELAEIFGSLGRFRDEIEQRQLLAALEPERAERLLDLALAYVRHGRADTAANLLAQAAERFPTDPLVQTEFARLQLTLAASTGDRTMARSARVRLEPIANTSVPPREALALYGRAQYLTGDTEAAERTLQRAATLLPVSRPALADLSEAAEQLGHWRIARDTLIQYVGLTEAPTERRNAARRIALLSRRLNDTAVAAAWDAIAAR